jgi:DNA-binding NarL/FixJ family response regulator
LEGLAGVAVTQGLVEQGARLFGACQALRESMGWPLALVYRANYEHDVGAARAQLDEATFAAAWAAGRALSLEQVIAEALRVPVETPSAQPTSPAPDRLSILTRRERQVLALLAQGASNRAIAERLVITERTAEIHVSNILGKLGATSRTQAATYALGHGLNDMPDA